MSSFLQKYGLEQTVTEEENFQNYVKRFESLDKLQLAVENAQNFLNKAFSLQTSVRKATDFNEKDYRLFVIAKEQITESVGIDLPTKKLSQEGIADYKSLALEGIGEIINKIIVAIKKAFDFIWNTIVSFFKWLFSSNKKNQEEVAINRVEEKAKESAKAATKVREEDMPYFNNLDILRGLDYGVTYINQKSLTELMIRLRDYQNNILKLASASSVEYSLFEKTIGEFNAKTDQIVRNNYENKSVESFDFMSFKNALYNAIASTVDVAVTQHYPKGNILKEINDIKGLEERCKNSSAPYSPSVLYIEGMGPDANKGQTISDLRVSPLIGYLSRQYFILYKGENENYVARYGNFGCMSLIKENTSRYLESRKLLEVISEYRKFKDAYYLASKDIQTQYASIYKSFNQIYEMFMEIRNFKKEKFMDDQTADSYVRCTNLILNYLKNILDFILNALNSGLMLSEKVKHQIQKYIEDHENKIGPLVPQS